jgi:hypothetical protein
MKNLFNFFLNYVIICFFNLYKKKTYTYSTKNFLINLVLIELFSKVEMIGNLQKSSKFKNLATYLQNILLIGLFGISIKLVNTAIKTSKINKHFSFWIRAELAKTTNNIVKQGITVVPFVFIKYKNVITHTQYTNNIIMGISDNSLYLIYKLNTYPSELKKIKIFINKKIADKNNERKVLETYQIEKFLLKSEEREFFTHVWLSTGYINDFKNYDLLFLFIVTRGFISQQFVSDCIQKALKNTIIIKKKKIIKLIGEDSFSLTITFFLKTNNPLCKDHRIFLKKKKKKPIIFNNTQLYDLWLTLEKNSYNVIIIKYLNQNQATLAFYLENKQYDVL